MRKQGCLIALALALILPVIGYKIYAWRFEMGRIPAGLAIAGTQYKSEQNWGAGPGGNETGFVVYTMDDASAAMLGAKAETLVDSAAIGEVMGESNQRYGAWRMTPVDVGAELRRWGQAETPPDQLRPPRIRDYLGVYGFEIAIDPTMVAMADRVIAAKGAYYAYGAGGVLIVVAPKEKVIVFAYAG